MKTSSSPVIDELFAWLRPADAIRMHGTDISTLIWTIDEAGDGIALARSATQGGLLEQARELLDADYGDRTLRTLIVAPNTCGNRRFHERPDLLEIEDNVDEGWCKWLAVRQLVNISRTAEAVELFADYLHESNVELIVTSHSSSEPLTFRSPLLEAINDSRAIIERLAELRRQSADCN